MQHGWHQSFQQLFYWICWDESWESVKCVKGLFFTGTASKIQFSRSTNRKNIWTYWVSERALRKLFGSSSWRKDRIKRRPCAMTEYQISSRLAQTNSVNKNFIIWPLSVENFENFVSTWIERFYITNLSLVFPSKSYRHFNLQKTRFFKKIIFIFPLSFRSKAIWVQGRDGFFRTCSRLSFYEDFLWDCACRAVRSYDKSTSAT